MKEMIKLVTFVPEDAADKVRQAMGDTGAGKLGDYSHCTFTIKGTGRFIPLPGSDPTVGEIGKLEAVSEERIEILCERSQIKEVVAAIKKVHPYEEVPIEIYPVELV